MEWIQELGAGSTTHYGDVAYYLTPSYRGTRVLLTAHAGLWFVLWPSCRVALRVVDADWTSGGALPLVSWLSSFRRGLGGDQPPYIWFFVI